MKKLALLLAMAAYSLQATAQADLDSLWNVWQDETQPDTSRLEAVHGFVRNGYLFSQPDSAFYYAQIQYEFAENKGLKRQMADALRTQGLSLHYRDEYTKAIEKFEKSLTIFQELDYKMGVAATLNSIGIAYDWQGYYPKALDYYTQSLRVKEQLADNNGIAASLTNIGAIHHAQDDLNKALDYYKQSLQLQQASGNQRGIAIALSNIGIVFKEQGELRKALDHYFQSLKILEVVEDDRGIAVTLHNIGVVYREQNDYAKALDYYSQSLNKKKQLGDKYGMVYSLLEIGVVHRDQGDYPMSLQYCQKGYNLAVEIDALELQKNSCNYLYTVYKAMGNSSKALRYYEKEVTLKDSLFNEENTKKLTQLEMQYEFDKKEAAAQAEQEKKDAVAAQELKRQKLARNGFMGGFAVVLLFAGVFFVQRNRIGKEKARSEELLLNILPEEVAEELKDKGHSDAQLIDHVTVLFTDFKGFTALSEKVTPKELVKDLHECFSAFDNICEKYGIEKIKTIGDAYMAAGGLPSPNTTHAQDVVNAALEMAEVIEKGKMKKVEQGLPFFEIRVGVHTGPVVAGIVGVKKFQYDIWGDTVNTASRMESSGEVGKVNVSQTTYELVKDQFACDYRGEVEAKGKGKLKMYFVLEKA